MDNIFIELDWEDNIGTFEGPVDHTYDNLTYSFELSLSIEGDAIFETHGHAEILIDDLVVTNRYGREVTEEYHYELVRNALTWE